MRQNDARYAVVKNRYTKIALRELGRDGADQFLVGPTAVALVRGDAVAVSKALLDFGRGRSGRGEGRLRRRQDDCAQEVVALSRLPNREQLLAMCCRRCMVRVRGLATVLHASVERFARVLQAVADQKAEQTTSDS